MHLLHAGSLSLDSLVAGLALAPLLPRASQRVAASALFGVADALGSLVATLVGTHMAARGMAAFYGAYVFAVVVVAMTLAASGRRRSVWALIATVAAALTVDNLLSPTAPLPAGVASFALALLGFAVGARVAGGLRSRLRIAWIGVGLLAAIYLSLAG